MYSYTCRNVSLQQQQRCCLKPGRLPSRTAVPVSKISQGWALLLVTRVGSSSNFLINAFWKAQYIVVFHPPKKIWPRTSHNHVGQLQPHSCVVHNYTFWSPLVVAHLCIFCQIRISSKILPHHKKTTTINNPSNLQQPSPFFAALPLPALGSPGGRTDQGRPCGRSSLEPREERLL